MSTEYVYMQEKYVEKENAKISVMTHAFMYGTSVFEGIRAYYNKEENQMYAFRVKEHFERLHASAKIMHINCDKSVDELCRITKELLKKNQYKTDVYIRPTLYKSGQSVSASLLGCEDDLLIFSAPLGDYSPLEKGLKVCVSNWKRNSDNSIPPRAKIGGAYANAALMSTEAKLAGFDDAIALNDAGEVAEGSIMNLFLVKGNKLITPDTTQSILDGITRNTVIAIAKDLNLEVEERKIQRTELYLADEAFYCGTSAQIVPISSIDNRNLGSGEVGEIVKKLQKEYFDVVKGRIDKYKEWCMPDYD